MYEKSVDLVTMIGLAIPGIVVFLSYGRQKTNLYWPAIISFFGHQVKNIPYKR